MDCLEGLADCGHASRGRYVQGCRCDACRAANTEYAKRRERSKAYEAAGGKKPYFVDAGHSRYLLRMLYGMGYSQRELGRLGIPKSTQHALTHAHSRSGKPLTRVKRETVERMAEIAVSGERKPSPGQLVDSSWLREQLEMYMSEGMTLTQVAEATGVDRQALYGVIRGRKEVKAATVAAFAVGKKALDKERHRMMDYEYTRG